MNNSGANTIIFVIILALVVFGLVWFFKDGAEEPPSEGLKVELTVPSKESTGADQ